MRNTRVKYVFSLAIIGGMALAVAISSSPLFSNLDQFVLVAENDIHLASSTQVSSGDLAVNGKLRISERNIINGSLWADEIRIAGDTSVNGDAFFNKLHVADDSEILGATSTPISLPIIKLPDVPSFQPGEDNLAIEGEETISSQDFNRLEVAENSKLTLNPGEYNLNELILHDRAKLLFTATTTVNVKQTFDTGNNVFVAPLNPQTSPKALTINVKSESKAKDKGKGKQQSQGTQPINIGNDSFLSFKLLAPNTKVILGEQNTFRGQIIAQEIQVGEEGVLSNEVIIAKESDPEKVVVSELGLELLVNEILLLVKNDTSLSDIREVANLIGGRISGFIPVPLIYKIEVTTNTIEDLDLKIGDVRNADFPFVIEVSPNFVSKSPLVE